MTITGPDARSAAPGQAVVDAAMLVLERMGLTPADLLTAPAARPAAPTFAEYIPVVSALLDACAADGVAYVPFFPPGSAFHPDKPVLTAPAVVATANRLGATTAQVALAWLLQGSPNLLLIPGTSSLTHLRENLAAAELGLDARAIDAIA